MRQETSEPVAEEINPCEHMRGSISALADGSLTGLMRWYTRWHASHCPRCGAALRGLRALLAQLQPLRGAPPAQAPDTLSAERRAGLEEAMRRADEESR
jgi:hypothetical protein